MQTVSGTLHFFVKTYKLFLCLSNGNLTEFLEIFHESKSSLACAGTGSLVSLNDLSFSIYLEISDFSIDLFNKLFHFCVI